MDYARKGGIDVGRMNQRITIQKKDRDKLPSGQLNESDEHWVDVATVWAECRCTRSDAADEAGIIQHSTEYRFYIRYRKGITAEMRIVWHDGKRKRTFQLDGPPVDWANRQGLTLIGKELVEYETVPD